MIEFDENKYEKLIKKWKAERPDYIYFVNDGILNKSVYCNKSPKILFLLKESNDCFIEVRNYDHAPKNGNSPVFWRNINMWSYAISKYFNGIDAIFEDCLSHKEDIVNHIAYVNIKKNAESKVTSNKNDLMLYAEKDKFFLVEQIKLLNPDIIICGMTKIFFDKLFDNHQVFDWIYETEKRIVVDFWHPASRKGYEKTFLDLKRLFTNKLVKDKIEGIRNSV